MMRRNKGILQYLALAYDYYLKRQSDTGENWVINRGKFHDAGVSGQFIDRCYESVFLKRIMEKIADGLAQPNESPEYKNANKACRMFADLYKDNSVICEGIKQFFEGDQTALNQLSERSKDLKEILYMSRIYNEEMGHKHVGPKS